jgi:hypothetical protein
MPCALAGARKLVDAPAYTDKHSGAYQQVYQQQRKAALAALVPQPSTSASALAQLHATLDIWRLNEEIEYDKTGLKAFNGRVTYGQAKLTPICHAWGISPTPTPSASALRVRVRDEYERRESIAIAEASHTLCAMRMPCVAPLA